MRLVLVRHADAHAGLTGTVSGPRGCAGLTELGRRQAGLLAGALARTGHLRPDVLVSSVLPRAVETASIVAPALGFDAPEQDCDLCEVHVGVADGLDWSEWERRFGPLDMPHEPDRVFAPGGESWDGFHHRVAATLDRLATTHDGRTVVAVTHAGFIVATLTVLLGLRRPDPGARILPTNTGVTEWHHDGTTGRWTLVGYNDATHLR